MNPVKAKPNPSHFHTAQKKLVYTLVIYTASFFLNSFKTYLLSTQFGPHVGCWEPVVNQADSFLMSWQPWNSLSGPVDSWARVKQDQGAGEHKPPHQTLAGTHHPHDDHASPKKKDENEPSLHRGAWVQLLPLAAAPVGPGEQTDRADPLNSGQGGLRPPRTSWGCPAVGQHS